MRLFFYSTKNMSTQIQVKGYKQVSSETKSGVTLIVYRNENTVQYHFSGTVTYTNTANSSSNQIQFSTAYKPINQLTIPMRHWDFDRIIINTDGKHTFVKNNTSTTSRLVETGCTFILKE